jgi:hypothetical protein
MVIGSDAVIELDKLLPEFDALLDRTVVPKAHMPRHHVKMEKMIEQDPQKSASDNYHYI